MLKKPSNNPVSLLFIIIVLLILTSTRASAATDSILIPNITVHFGDWTEPQTKLFIHPIHQEILEWQEHIVNGSFEDGTNGWTTKGDVTPCNEEENTAVCIGKNTPAFVESNELSQVIAQEISQVCFEFRLHTVETLKGFDDPAFLVLVNNLPIFEQSATLFNAKTPSEQNNWISQCVFLPKTEDQHTLQFRAGNTGDLIHNSWVELRKITTLPFVTKSSTLFSLKGTDLSPITTFLEKDGVISPISLKPFSLAPLLSNSISFWSTDDFENKEQTHSFPITLDDEKPEPIAHLWSTIGKDREYRITFENLYPEKTAAYDIRYSHDPITTENIDSLPQAFVQEKFHRAPKHNETLYLQLPRDVQEWNVAVRIIDLAGNVSDPQIETERVVL